MHRRALLQGAVAFMASGAWLRRATAATVNSVNVRELQNDWRLLAPPGIKLPSPVDKLDLTESAWRKRLTPEQFDVLREEGTERAGSSPLNDETHPGLFVCAGCGLPLFTSAMKYDSGTGWPSFFTVIPGVVGTKLDFRLVWPRTEYHCARCGGHQGHRFDDGPPPTHQRWCNNGVALKFLPKST